MGLRDAGRTDGVLMGPQMEYFGRFNMLAKGLVTRMTCAMPSGCPAQPGCPLYFWTLVQAGCPLYFWTLGARPRIATGAGPGRDSAEVAARR